MLNFKNRNDDTRKHVFTILFSRSSAINDFRDFLQFIASIFFIIALKINQKVSNLARLPVVVVAYWILAKKVTKQFAIL